MSPLRYIAQELRTLARLAKHDGQHKAMWALLDVLTDIEAMAEDAEAEPEPPMGELTRGRM